MAGIEIVELVEEISVSLDEAETVEVTVDYGVPGPQGPPGTGDGREIQLSTSATHLRWRYVGDTSWTNLLALSELEGSDGDSHVPNPFTQPDNRWLRTQDGALVFTDPPTTESSDPAREIELSVSSTHLRWRYVGDSSWTNLLALSTLEGDTHVPDPSSEADDRWLKTQGGALVFTDPPVTEAPESSDFLSVIYDGDNDAARPDAETVYWKNWPSGVTPANAIAGDLVFTPDAD